jgi:hypothetical protein
MVKTAHVIAPEPAVGINKQTSRLALLRNNLLVSALIFAALEIWRPCFYLTDDNLDGGLPFFTEMGHHLLNGQSPFFSDHLFGGHYDLSRDATFFVWHPVYLLGSLLAGTPFYFLILDFDAFLFVMLTTAGFVNLAWYLRRDLELKISDGWIMFFTMSFTYSIIALTTGASWLNYLVNQGVLPWLTLGILQKSWKAGIGLVALFSLHHILGGHPLAMISNDVFLTVFAIGTSICRRSILPVGCWVAGNAIALVAALPLFFPILEGFFSSSRSLGVTLEDMQSNNVDFNQFPTGLFVGMALWIIHPPEHAHVTYTLAMCSSAAAWCLIPAALSRARWRGIEVVTLAVVLFTVLMVCRPVWISELMMHLPVLKSMRWPFRELVQFQFFFHLFLLLRPPGLTAAHQRLTAIFSACIMIIPMFLYIIGPTLNEMPLGRKLIFSGDFDRYWDHVRPLLTPSDQIAVLIPYPVYEDDNYEKPNGLLGTFNYSCLARVISVSGYSHTSPANQLSTQTIPYYPNGAYDITQRAALIHERPDLKFITLESIHPVRITLSSADGPTIDLTPYVPEYFKYPVRQALR